MKISLIYYLLYGLYFIGMSLFLYLLLYILKDFREPVYIIYITLFILSIYSIRHISLKSLRFDLWRLQGSRSLFIQYCYLLLHHGNHPDSCRFCDHTFVSRRLPVSLSTSLSVCLLSYTLSATEEIIFSSNIWRSIYSILLYLCTFEIAPLVLMFKFLERQGVF